MRHLGFSSFCSPLYISAARICTFGVHLRQVLRCCNGDAVNWPVACRNRHICSKISAPSALSTGPQRAPNGDSPRRTPCMHTPVWERAAAHTVCSLYARAGTKYFVPLAVQVALSNIDSANKGENWEGALAWAAPALSTSKGQQSIFLVHFRKKGRGVQLLSSTTAHFSLLFKICPKNRLTFRFCLAHVPRQLHVSLASRRSDICISIAD